MKFLLMPENNSLSHISKCLSIREILINNRHEVHIAIGIKHSDFLNRLGIKYHVLSDIQETDNGGFPSFKWFTNIETITNCIDEEVALLNKIKPDRVLGVFRFTVFASSQITNVPYDSLICGCIIPDSNDVLGFDHNDEGIGLQEKFLDNFFRFAGNKTSLALSKFGLRKIEDIRYALKGERTFLWDFPEFMPINKNSNIIHVGPFSLNHWPYDPFNLEDIIDSKYPIAIVSFGTCISDKLIVQKIVDILFELGYKVIVAAGGQKEMLDIRHSDSRVIVLNFAPLIKIFPYASLLVTHGGQMTIFEALKNEIPVIVMPLQPEQSHNGVCLERIGCGKRLIPSTQFTGIPEDYTNVFNRMTDDEIKFKIDSLVNNSKTRDNLTAIKGAISRYDGANSLARYLEV